MKQHPQVSTEVHLMNIEVLLEVGLTYLREGNLDEAEFQIVNAKRCIKELLKQRLKEQNSPLLELIDLRF